MRRLTRLEYDNTVRDLLGDTSTPASAFMPDDASEGYAANAVTPVSRVVVEDYMTAAEALAANAATRIGELLPCDPGQGPSCARTFIQSFGSHAYRRPIAAAEADALFTLFESRSGDFASGVQLVIEAVLQSPHFLYRVEFGTASADGAEVVPLDDFEVASRLSYFLWASMPDDELFAAAIDGELSEPQGVADQARRMVGDERFRDTLVSFYAQWLGLDGLGSLQKDADRFPELTPDLRDAMYVETMVFVDELMRHGDRSLQTLLTADFTFANPSLQAHYGVVERVDDPGFSRVRLPGGQRSGVLTQASLMTALSEPDQTSPVLRGKFVRDRLLCSAPPPPPADADLTPPAVDPSLPTKERWAAHRANPQCEGCHRLMDPIGLGFQHYDAVGRWTEQDGEHPADARGEIVGTEDLDGTFDGALELGALLAESEEVHRCVARQWLRFALGRAEADEDSCSLDQIDSAFADSDLDLEELVVSIVTSDAFRYWRIPS